MIRLRSIIPAIQSLMKTNEQTGEVKDIMTDTKQVSERPVVVYTNNCSAANRRELRITKRMNPMANTDDTFSFKIELGPDKVIYTALCRRILSER